MTPIALTRLAWIDALSPVQALLLWCLLCACWLGAILYTIFYVRPSGSPRPRKELF